MSEEKKKRIGYVLVLLAILLGVAFFIILISQKKTSYTSEDISFDKQEVLICSTGDNGAAFFQISGVTEVKHEVKIILSNQKINKLFYLYNGKTGSEEQAEAAMTSMHATYDIYMGKNNSSYASKPTANFSHVGNEVRADIYSKVDSINSVTAKFFFLDGDRISEILEKNGEELKDYYTIRGFSCEHQK